MPFTSFKETIDLKAYLCHHCFNKAKKCLDMIHNLKEKFDGLLNMASKLTTPTQPSCRKRLASNRDDFAISNGAVQSGSQDSDGEI